MKPKTSLYFCIILVLLFCGNSFAQTQNAEKAKELWEKAIEAKGGREKLHSVRNMVVSSEGKFYKGLKKNNIHLENLYVFPDKSWSWNDQRPSIFGLDMTMYNGEIGKKYSVQFGEESFKGLETIDSNSKNTNFSGLNLELLETKWNQPQPIKISQGKVENKKVDVIQTLLLDNRIDFMLDQNTHLPLRVIVYKDGKIVNGIKLSDYADSNGIQMPTKVIFEASDGNMEYVRKYKFNVEYDESIFTTPPTFKYGSEAWKPKVKE